MIPARSAAWRGMSVGSQARRDRSSQNRSGPSGSGKQRHRRRDRARFDLAIESKLRGCALLKVRPGELVSGVRVLHRAIVIQQKTGRPVQFELLEPARTNLLEWLERRDGSLNSLSFEPDRSLDVRPGGHIPARLP